MHMHVSVNARVHGCVSVYERVGVSKCSHMPVSGRGGACVQSRSQAEPCSGTGYRLASMPQEISRWRERATESVWVREASGLFTRWP